MSTQEKIIIHLIVLLRLINKIIDRNDTHRHMVAYIMGERNKPKGNVYPEWVESLRKRMNYVWT